MLSLECSFQLPYSMPILALHHDCQLFAGTSVLALISRPSIAVDSAVQDGHVCLDFIKFKIVYELIEACIAAVSELPVKNSPGFPNSRTVRASTDLNKTHHRC